MASSSSSRSGPPFELQLAEHVEDLAAERLPGLFPATASGQASEKRRRLDELLNGLQRGDRLVVSELSRLGRSLGQIVAILDALAKAGVAFVALKENIHVEGKRDIQTKVMTTLFALSAEVERGPDLRAHPRRSRQGQGLGPQARASEGLAGRLPARRQGGRDPALPQAWRLQDRHRQDHRRLPYRPLQLHDHQRDQADALACMRTRMLSVPFQAAACNIGLLLRRQSGVGTPRSLQGRAVSVIFGLLMRCVGRCEHLLRVLALRGSRICIEAA